MKVRMAGEPVVDKSIPMDYGFGCVQNMPYGCMWLQTDTVTGGVVSAVYIPDTHYDEETKSWVPLEKAELTIFRQ